jgi:nucleolar protein 56
MRLITTWYGSFAVDEDGKVLASAIFPKSAGEIAQRLRLIREGEVLDEDIQVAPSDEGFTVTEDRLMALDGALKAEPGTSAAAVAVPGPEDVGIPASLLRDASLVLATSSIREALPEDQPVILYLRAMDLIEREATRCLEMLRYWHSFHFPELGALVGDEEFIALLSDDPRRASILEKRPELDPGVDAGRSLAEGEADAMVAMARHIKDSRIEGRRLRKTLEDTVVEAAPNLAILAGPLVGARLISLAGSLERLSRMPSSTIQLLGAEKALFLHIKEGAPAPKHGVIFQHPSVHSSPPWLRGRVARALAGKIAIATRGDSMKSRPDGTLGADLREIFLKRVQQLRIEQPQPPAGWKRRPRDERKRRKGRGGPGRGRQSGKGRGGPRTKGRGPARRRRR